MSAILRGVLGVAAVICCLSTAAVGQGEGEKKLAKLKAALQPGWKTIEVFSFHNGGDSIYFGDAFFLTLLPDDRVLLSWRKGGKAEPARMPLPLRFVEPAEVEIVLKRVVEFAGGAIVERTFDERHRHLEFEERELLRIESGASNSDLALVVLVNRGAKQTSFHEDYKFDSPLSGAFNRFMKRLRSPRS